MSDHDRDNKPRLIAFEVTRRCRYNCRHCRADAGRTADELTTEQCKRIIDGLASYAKCVLILTGGEPTERSDIRELGPARNRCGPSRRDGDLRLFDRRRGGARTEERRRYRPVVLARRRHGADSRRLPADPGRFRCRHRCDAGLPAGRFAIPDQHDHHAQQPGRGAGDCRSGTPARRLLLQSLHPRSHRPGRRDRGGDPASRNNTPNSWPICCK